MLYKLIFPMFLACYVLSNIARAQTPQAHENKFENIFMGLQTPKVSLTNKGTSPVQFGVLAQSEGIIERGGSTTFTVNEGFAFSRNGKDYAEKEVRLHNPFGETRKYVLPVLQRKSLALNPGESVELVLNPGSYFVGLQGVDGMQDQLAWEVERIFQSDSEAESKIDLYFPQNDNNNLFTQLLSHPQIQKFSKLVLGMPLKGLRKKLDSSRESARRHYRSFLNNQSTKNNDVPKVVHKLWITNLDDTDLPDHTLENFCNFLNTFNDWHHIFWVLEKRTIPSKISQIRASNLEFRELSDLPFFWGKPAFEYFVRNNYYCFASNIARFNVLYHFGGLYLDIGWGVAPEAKPLFECFEYIFLPHPSCFIDVWCAFCKPKNKILFSYLNYLDNYMALKRYGEEGDLPDYYCSASMFCAIPFSAFVLKGLQESDKVLFSPQNGVFRVSRLNTWLKSPKFNNSPAFSLDRSCELLEKIFPRQKRVAQIGFFDERNCGDELFHYVAKKFLEGYCLTKVPFRSLYNLESILPHFDTFIIGGGDLVNLGSEKQICLPSALRNKQVRVCGIGVHNQKRVNSNAENDIRRFFEQPGTSLISVRDELSKASLEPLTAQVPLVSPDLVFSLDLPYQNPRERKKIGVILRNVMESGYTVNTDVFGLFRISVIEELIKKGFEINIISMRDIASECEPIKQIFLSKSSLITYTPYQTPDQTIEDIKKNDFILTMRYHGAILAAMLGKPVVALDVSDKFKGLSSVLERDDIVTHINDPFLLEKIMTVKPVKEEKIQELRSKSREQLNALRRSL